MKEKSFSQRVVESVMSRGESTSTQVLADVGKYISAAQAAQIAHNRANRPSVKETGKRNFSLETAKKIRVSENLAKLYGAGKIRRVRPGVYAPLEPKIFVPEQTLSA